VSRLREAWWRVGLPDAISWPAFIATLLVGVMGYFANSRTTMPLITGLAIALVGQLVLWLPLVLLKITLLRNARRSRPLLVLVVFLAGAGLRAIAMIAITSELYGLQSLRPLGWFVGIFSNIGPVFVVSAIVVSSLRERRRQITYLAGNQKRIEESLIEVNGALSQRNVEAVDRVRGILERELTKLDGTHAQASLATLQRTAVEVVRPMSHELAKSVPRYLAPVVAPTTALVPWVRVFDSAATGMPFRPLLIGALMGWELLGAISIRPADALLFVLFDVMFLVGFALANRVVERVNRKRTAGFRISTTILMSLAVSWSIAATVPALLGTTTSDYGFIVAFVVLGPGFALGTTILSALARERERVVGELTESTKQLERVLVRQREVEWFQQKALSRALHGPIQMAVTAAAIRLDASIREGTVQPGIVNSVRQELLNGLDVLHQAPGEVTSLDQAIERMRATWDGVCSIEATVSDAAVAVIAADGVLRSCVIDIVTEAVSNAVWHAKADQTKLEIALDPQAWDVLMVEVVSNGLGDALSENRGLGTQQLDDWTLTWSREINEQGSVLEAALPVASTGR
jgi:anti-sigma regulatory factor (Ser/Thr protein kinase)